MDLLNLHLHQPNPLPRLRRLRDRKTGASLQTPLGDESHRSSPAALVGVLSPPQQQRRASVYALRQQWTARVGVESTQARAPFFGIVVFLLFV
jgi:hypothetical protein